MKIQSTAVVIGFDPTGYEVSEDAGSETLFVRLISGVLEREVTVFFSTSPGTATSAGMRCDIMFISLHMYHKLITL